MPFAMIMSSSATYQTVITRNSIQNPDITTLLMGNLLLLSYVLIGMTVVRYSTLRSENWQKMGIPGSRIRQIHRILQNQKHPVTGKQYSLIYTGDSQETHGEVFGWHPPHGEHSFIQQRMAAIFADTLRKILLPKEYINE